MEMTVVKTIGDGSCFFHAISEATSKEYRNKDTQGKVEHVKLLRRLLSLELVRRDRDGLRAYDKLANGTLSELSKSIPECTVDNMIATLNSEKPVSNLFNEFVSDCLNIDIYLVSATKGIANVYKTGTDDNILFKGRKSVLILVTPGHYELLVKTCSRCSKVKYLFEGEELKK